MKLIRPGIVPYGQALALQYQLRDLLLSSSADSTTGPRGYLLCLEHKPVITLGKRGSISDILAPQWFIDRGIEAYKIDRGGELTYHGPGQLVIYPILALDSLGNKGIVDVVRGLANSVCETLRLYGVPTVYDTDHPGVWTTSDMPRKKIASVGMRVSKGISTHGTAVNITNDLTPFSMFVPCGMPDTPMARLMDYVHDISVDEVADRVLDNFAAFLNTSLEVVEVELPPREKWEQPLSF